MARGGREQPDCRLEGPRTTGFDPRCNEIEPPTPTHTLTIPPYTLLLYHMIQPLPPQTTAQHTTSHGRVGM